MSTTEELLKSLHLQEALNRIYMSDDFQIHVLPIIKKAISNDNWINPLEEDFHKKYVYAYALTQAYKEILNVFKNSGDAAQRLKSAIDKPVKAHGVK